MFEQSSASGKGGGIRSGHLVLLNNAAIYSTLRTSAVDGKWLPQQEGNTNVVYIASHM